MGDARVRPTADLTSVLESLPKADASAERMKARADGVVFGAGWAL